MQSRARPISAHVRHSHWSTAHLFAFTMSQAGATQYEKGAKPEVGKYDGFHHCHFYVGNAFQASAFYCMKFGFTPLAYRGLETGHRDVATHVIKQNNLIFAFSTPLNGEHPINDILRQSGDGVHDVAFQVDDCRGVFAAAVARGAEVVMEPTEESDEDGTVIMATVKTYGHTVHTLVQCNGYKGEFLPNYKKNTHVDAMLESLPPIDLVCIDHVVGNQPDGQMESAVDWYCKVLQFHRFWSVDDKAMHTEYSALRSVVVTDFDEKVKMPINEPAPGLRKSQIQEYVDFYAGAGVQHVALYTNDILKTVANLRARGGRFLKVPETYYEDLRSRIKAANFTMIKEDLDEIQRLNILVDFDENGYLLQLFSIPQEDRPTLFFEIIQRTNHWGFGVGNFKALFQAIERAQAERGNL